MGRLIIDGNDVYEIDEECIREKERAEQSRLNAEHQKEEHQKEESQHQRYRQMKDV